MRQRKPWHEDDGFWQATLPVLFPKERLQAAAGEVDKVLALSGAAAGCAVLDLPCGVGRHSLELARRGFRVTGVDRTRLYLQRAAEVARSEGLQLELVQEDMRAFHRPAAFALVLNLFTSFGYFEDPLEDRRVVENLHASLQPGGALVMDMMGKEVLARVFRERDWQRIGDLLVLEERRVQRDWSWIDSRWTLIGPENRVEVDLSHRLYSAAELGELLRGVGFRSVEFFGDLAGGPYDPNALRLVAVARRGG
jgi:SAM-dependent methyltransferase